MAHKNEALLLSVRICLSALVSSLLLGASSALCGPPDPANFTIPCGLTLVGTTGGVADPLGQFTVVVRDASGSLLAGIPLVIDFSNCTPDIRVCATQTHAGVSPDCSGSVGKVTTTTDGAGSSVLRITGGANNTGAQPSAAFKCASISAGTPLVLLGHVNVSVLDQNGSGGVNPADLSLWLRDAFDADYEARADLNCTQTINPADLWVMYGSTLLGGSASSCATYCH